MRYLIFHLVKLYLYIFYLKLLILITMTYIYRIKKNEEIYYIGITDNLSTRISNHKNKKEWFTTNLTIEYIKLKNKTSAKMYETYLINTLAPSYNISENTGANLDIVNFNINTEWLLYNPTKLKNKYKTKPDYLIENIYGFKFNGPIIAEKLLYKILKNFSKLTERNCTLLAARLLFNYSITLKIKNKSEIGSVIITKYPTLDTNNCFEIKLPNFFLKDKELILSQFNDEYLKLLYSIDPNTKYSSFITNLYSLLKYFLREYKEFPYFILRIATLLEQLNTYNPKEMLEILKYITVEINQKSDILMSYEIEEMNNIKFNISYKN